MTSGGGGSGIVIIAYPDTFDDITTIGSSLTVAGGGPDTSSRSGYKVYKFTAGNDDIIF